MSYLIANPEDRFSHDEAHMIVLHSSKTSNLCGNDPGGLLLLLITHVFFNLCQLIKRLVTNVNSVSNGATLRNVVLQKET